MSKLYLVGIDPGKNGGIARAFSEKGKVLWTSFSTMSMSEDVGEIYDFIRKPIDNRVRTIIGLEQLGGFIMGASGASLFKLGAQYGKVKAIAELLASMSSSVSVKLIPPQKWQAETTSLKRRDFPSENKWKSHLKMRACTWLDDNKITKEKPTLKTADAILILRYLHLLHCPE